MDWSLILYIMLSVIIVSAISLIGLLTFFVRSANIGKIALYLVGLSVGALLGDVFIHLLPDAFQKSNGTLIGIYVIVGIAFSFVVEKFIHWRHCHVVSDEHHIHSFTYMNIIGDSVHNFIDGLVIAGAYFVNTPAGIATTIAVAMHEIPHEFGNFGVLVHGGFTRLKAILFNGLTALTALLGAIVGILIGTTQGLFIFLVPFAAGNLVYIAGTDLIPELHKHTESCDIDASESIKQFIAIAIGVGLMIAILALE